MGLTGQNGLEAGVCRGKGTAAAKTLSQEQGVMFETPKEDQSGRTAEPERDCRGMSWGPKATLMQIGSLSEKQRGHWGDKARE